MNSIKVVWKRSLDSKTGHISQATYLSESISTDSLSECVFRSHDQSCNFSGNTETDSPPGCVFRSHDQSCNFTGNTETDSLSGYVVRSHDQSCNLSGNTETDSPLGCVFRSHDPSLKKDFYLPPRLKSAFIPCSTSFSYCFALGTFLYCLSTSSKFIITYILL